MLNTNQTIEMLIKNATPTIKIHRVAFSEPQWIRKVKEGDHRKGPWHHLEWELLNKPEWVRQSPCLYLVIGKDGKLRYVGISRRRLKDRWRVSPAYDAQSSALRPEKELFHSQCQKWLEAECKRDSTASFDVKCLHGDALHTLLQNNQTPLSGFLELGDDFEGIAAAVERWICNHSGIDFKLWNTAMTC